MKQEHTNMIHIEIKLDCVHIAFIQIKVSTHTQKKGERKQQKLEKNENTATNKD